MLQQRLTLIGLTMIAVGSCIGSGIFTTPSLIVKEVPHAGLALLVWGIGGLVALTGALTFSELGGMFPKSGGVYVYLKEAYGELAGFLYGWAVLLVINTGALAGLCAAFADYLRIFAPEMSDQTKTIVAAVTMVILTAINALGVNVSQGLANFFTSLKLWSIAAIIIVAFIFVDTSKVAEQMTSSRPMPTNLVSAMLTALIGVFFSIGGWHHATYVAGEAIDAKRTVPRAMLLGVLIVTVMYLLVNLAYLLILPIDVMAETKTVAGDAMSRLASWGGKAVAIAIALSIFGTISIYTMSAPRIYHAMAEDGVFFRSLAYVHPTFRTPIIAMVVQVVWAVAVLVFFQGLFDQIITFVTFMDIAFMGLAGAAIFVFRWRRPNVERPVFAWGYPIVPAIFVLISAAFAINTLREKPDQALPGLILMLVGVGAFYAFKATAKSQRKNQSA